MRFVWRVTERFRATNFLGRTQSCDRRALPGLPLMVNPFEFIQQVRSEAARVVWPSRRETLITTGIVMLMALFASLFLILVDQGLRILVSLALGFGHSN